MMAVLSAVFRFSQANSGNWLQLNMIIACGFASTDGEV
jgi:hypothetical protein